MEVKIVKKDGKDFVSILVPVENKVSASGKMKLLASSGGFMGTDLKVDGKPVKVNLNVGISI